MRLTAAEIAKRAGGVVVSGDPEVLVTSWGFDSRALLPGACFVALRDHRDGHDFVAAGFRAGAHVALIDREVSGLRPSAAATLVSEVTSSASASAEPRFARMPSTTPCALARVRSVTTTWWPAAASSAAMPAEPLLAGWQLAANSSGMDGA